MKFKRGYAGNLRSRVPGSVEYIPAESPAYPQKRDCLQVLRRKLIFPFNKRGIMKQRRTFILVFLRVFIGLALMASVTSADSVTLADTVETAAPEPEVIGLLARIQEASHRAEGQRADSLVEYVISRWPDSPVGYYARTVRFQVKTQGCVDILDADRFQRDLQSAIDLATARLETHPDDPWNRYILGMSLGMDAVAAARNGHIWNAWRTARRSMGHLEAVLEADNTMTDAWLPIGAYHFWRGEALKKWAWLPFIEDTREQGLTEVRRAAQGGRLTRVSARSMLLWAYLALEQPEETLALADSLRADYPQNRSFMWARAEALYALNRWEEAAEAFGLVIAAFGSEQHHCPGYIGLRTEQAMALVELGRCTEALPVLRECAEYAPPEQVTDEFAELREEIETYISRCEQENR